MGQVMGMMDTSRDDEHQHTVGLIAGLITAFGVFLVGGTVVLFTWVSDQRDTPAVSVQSPPPVAVPSSGQGLVTETDGTGVTKPEESVLKSAPIATKRTTAKRAQSSGGAGVTASSSRSRAQTPHNAQRKAANTASGTDSVKEVKPVYALDLPARRGWDRTESNSEPMQGTRPNVADASGSSSPSVAVGATSAKADEPTGRGTVIIMGDADRVRLTGSRGSFGAGAIPAGAYTIQATFDGGEAQMAGTVNIGDGERVRIVCIAGRQSCSRI